MASIIRCALFFIIVASVAASCADTLCVYFLDVGHGDAILVDFGEWECLIDTGYKKYWPKASRCDDLLEGVIDAPLEVFVLSHADQDHYSAFERVACPCQVERVLHGPDSAATSKVQELLASLQPDFAVDAGCDLSRTQARSVSVDMTPDTFGNAGLEWRVLHPTPAFAAGETEDNENSLVLLLTYGSVSFLFTGDIEEEAQAALADCELPDHTVILKVPHHGRQADNTLTFLERVNPALAIISTHDLIPEVSAELLLLGIPFFVTHTSGTICVSTNGKSVWVTTDTLGRTAVCTPPE